MRTIAGCVALAAAMTAGSPVAFAQTWPVKTVRVVTPYPAGGAIDLLARQFAARFSTQWGQPVLVENRPGGSTIPGTDAVAKSVPDGHTLLLSTDAGFSINPHLFAKLPYDAQRDFIPVTLLVRLEALLVANRDVPASNLAELIALAKAKPGTLNYGSFGIGSQPHLAGEMLKHKTGIDIVHIPYAGPSQVLPALVAGDVQLTFVSVGLTTGLLGAGKIKALGISGPQRSPVLPQVPTFAEQGFPAVGSHGWFGLFVPAGSPREAVERIYRDAARILAVPEFRDKEIVARGFEPVGSSPAEFAAFLKADSSERAQEIRISGVKAE